jgi:hypothetical protein
MAKLTDELKTEIVVRLAQYEGYSEIARILLAEYSVSVTRFQARSYDPTKPTYAAGDKWREIFWATRNSYLNAVDQVPIAHQAYRLNELQRNYDRARHSGNIVLANKTLEQAAKEVGGVLTKERTLNLQDDRGEDYRSLTPEERRARVYEILKTALESAKKEKLTH